MSEPQERNLHQELDDNTLNENVNEQHEPCYKSMEEGLERWLSH